MAGVLEENRRRLALVLAVVGIGMILCGFLLAVHHQSQIESGQVLAQHSSPEHKPGDVARVLKYILFMLIVLVGIFSISVFAFLRWSRNFRRSLLYRPHPPTPADDVWAMHRLPEELGEASDSQDG